MVVFIPEVHGTYKPLVRTTTIHESWWTGAFLHFVGVEILINNGDIMNTKPGGSNSWSSDL